MASLTDLVRILFQSGAKTVPVAYVSVPPQFRRNSTPLTSEMLFWDDLELSGHRWLAQLPKLAPGRCFELAPPTATDEHQPRRAGGGEGV